MEEYKFKKIGEDVRINPTCQINRPELIELGSHISIDMCTYISVGAILGDYIHIAPHVCIMGGINAMLIMEDFTGISAGSKIVCASDDFNQGFLGPFLPLEFRNVINKPIIFKRFSAIGVNSVILPGVTLAEGSVLGANSLLIHDTEPWTIYAGSPAKPIKLRNSDMVLFGAKKMGYV
jgi:galactoside O-acetyltransferase